MEINPTTGLTDEEQRVYDSLVETWNAYSFLPVQHSAEQQEFSQAINRCQELIAIRIARRTYPDGWPCT